MKMNSQETIDLFQEAFNVMVYSLNREYELNDDRAKPTLSIPETNKNIMNPDFCYATFSLKKYFETRFKCVLQNTWRPRLSRFVKGKTLRQNF
jgi:hypothetical protein